MRLGKMLLSLALALTMIVSLASTAFAADSVTFTGNSEAGKKTLAASVNGNVVTLTFSGWDTKKADGPVTVSYTLASITGNPGEVTFGNFVKAADSKGGTMEVTVAPVCEDQKLTFTAATGTKDIASAAAVTVKKDETKHNFDYANPAILTGKDAGSIQYTCLNCGKTSDKLDPKDKQSNLDKFCAKYGHNHQGKVTTPATCLTEGSETSSCGTCHIQLSSETVPALGHDFKSLIGHEDATCADGGFNLYKCTRCEETFNELIPATGHDWDDDVTAPTCTEQGYTTYVCKNDSEHNYIGEYSEALGHNFSVPVSHQDATCEDDGCTVLKCSRCDETDEDIIAAHGHDYGTGVVTAPTCTEQGYTTYTCNNDSTHSYDGEYTLPLGHDFTVPAGHKDATCEEGGYDLYKCSRCEETFEEIITALGHSLSTETIEATCENPGSITTTCSRCSYNETNTTPALGHDWGEDACKNCGAPKDSGGYSDDVVGATAKATVEFTPKDKNIKGDKDKYSLWITITETLASGETRDIGPLFIGTFEKEPKGTFIVEDYEVYVEYKKKDGEFKKTFIVDVKEIKVDAKVDKDKKSGTLTLKLTVTVKKTDKSKEKIERTFNITDNPTGYQYFDVGGYNVGLQLNGDKKPGKPSIVPVYS